MTASPSSSAQAAREALAVRLQHLRKDAGLTGKDLSARCGWHPAKTTRIQKGDAPPSDADIRAWCAACGAEDQADDLIATARAVDSMYLEWRRLHRSGMRKVQEDWNSLHERTHVCRVYVSNVPPGFFQTPAFATALMERITAFQGTPNDVSEAVAARIARSRFLYEGGHRYVVLMEEAVLRFRTADPDAMRGQLRHLLAVMPLASVSLGIIPFTVQRMMWPLEAFYLHDDEVAVVETLTAEIKVKQPGELADYTKAFAGLAEMAVYGDDARALIKAALDALE
ncbi:helix-turn-helix domain-containing protein [Streptomyces albidoflavus]|uniref:helix-turn-helix domain-containing protein n=1 Tax=Streptomyces albidoflavus TaxID=1886 RepID=UPI0010211226|nr:helix-turn-helix transcriptional regulator [Streptomyces albidoflavus]MBV7652704.1 helix-turn-helix domain-containing protein [Streptomyces albidoflavus]MBV7714173.1 helix-turn-helix domain-containing protein [Streptomyces albidoflavus]RZE14612.1 transcriptional regulator [Streptomyces albidoflavus]